MQKGILLIVMLIVALGCQSSRQKKNENTVEKPKITVSIIPQKFFIEQIAGDLFDVNIMVPSGASPDDYEPTPKQLTQMVGSKVFFYVGHLGFEKSWMKRFTTTAPDVRYVSSSMGLDLLEGSCSHNEEAETEGDGHDHGHSHGTDPHVWTSPENVKVMSRTMCTVLSEIYPEHKAEFEKNLDAFIKKINEMDTRIRLGFNELESRSFMIYHPALAYFARDYFLNQHSIEFEGKSPSTAHMKKMVDLAKAEKINTVFIQSQFENAKAEAIAKEIGATVVSIDPLAYDWLKETEEMAGKLKLALTKKN